MDFRNLKEWIYTCATELPVTDDKYIYVIGYDAERLSLLGEGIARLIAVNGCNAAIFRATRQELIDKTEWLSAEGAFFICESVGEVCVEFIKKSDKGRNKSKKRYFSFSVSDMFGKVTKM